MSFEIGSQVVCIDANFSYLMFDGIIAPLKEGEIYTIKSIYECDCRNIYLDVGILAPSSMVCPKCWKRTNSNIWWFRDSRFIPLEFNSEVESLSKEALIDV